MLRSLHIENLTVFPEANLAFGKDLNLIVGENGTGKTHVLKAAYAAIAANTRKGGDPSPDPLTKTYLQTAIAEKLRAVFRPDELGRLARRARGHSKCILSYKFDSPQYDVEFSFSTSAKSEVTIKRAPSARIEKPPVFLPTRELLTIYPNFVSLYETTHLPFEETWRDTCILLGAPLARGPRESTIKRLLEPLEHAMGGSVELDKSGRFYLNLASGSMEMHLVAEGLRKLATVARLIANGSLIDKGYLFWDEPEANLNPKVVKALARTILQIANGGIQVFIATHSLFLLRELHILQKKDFQAIQTGCFGLHLRDNGAVHVKQGATMDDIGDISALDEELAQSDRYLDAEATISNATAPQP